jgi:hypothetical protein
VLKIFEEEFFFPKYHNERGFIPKKYCWVHPKSDVGALFSLAIGDALIHYRVK